MMTGFALFWLALCSYLLLTVNYRAIAQGNYLHAAVSDGLIALLAFILIKNIAQAEGALQTCSYVVGGMTGSLAGIWLSKRLAKESK